MREDKDFDDLVSFVSAGDSAAADFLRQFCDIAHVWDDLVDGDKKVSVATVNKAFTDLLVVLPENRFYRAHIGYLHPIIVNAIINWRVANRFEQHYVPDATKLEVAYIIRSTYVDLFSAVGYLLCGMDHGIASAEQARLLCHTEGLAGYLKNLEKEKAARGMPVEGN